MGFSAALQSSKGHEHLLSRQDAELRLIDIMKRGMQQKAKCDREYAIGLANVAQQGLKIDRIDELQGSHITKAWRSFMDELEQTSRQLKLNADHLEAICQDKLTQLYHDKRKARKHYQEEHLKISTQFTHITEDVTRKKLEYQKCLENYKVLRSRFEEQFVKGGRSGRKIDDVADKYKKACRKLHLAHNEYVLLINEAIEIETDFRTILLPGLLEHQQTLQEGFIQTWKNLLLEIIQSGDLTSEKFGDIQRRIETNVQNISPKEEYKEFTEKHKTGPPTPTVFQFDESLTDDNLGILKANTITVDNLTIEWLRNRLSELETSVKECQEKQIKYCSENGISTPSTPTMSGLNGSVNGHNGTKDTNKNSKDLNALRCHERQMLKLVEIIKTALNEIGCEELPSGCDEVIEQTIIDQNISQEQPGTPHASSVFMQKGAEFMSIFRTFRRKSSATQSPSRTPRFGRSTENLSASVISLDFREVTCPDDVHDNNETLICGVDTNHNLNSNRTSNNIYVDIDSHTNPFVNFTPEDEYGKEEIQDDESHSLKINDQQGGLSNDSKNNLLLGGEEYTKNECNEIYRFQEQKEPSSTLEVAQDALEVVKTEEKLSFTDKLMNRMKKSSSIDTGSNSSILKGNQEKSESSGIKDRLSRFKSKQNDKYRPLSETESELNRKTLKKAKPKRRKLFRQLTEERNLMSNEEKFEPIENPDTSIASKKKSFSKSIMTHIREIKIKNGGSNKIREIESKDRDKNKAMADEMANRLSEIRYLFESDGKDIEFKEIIESEMESLLDVGNPNGAGYHSLLTYESNTENTITSTTDTFDFVSMPPSIQITDLDEDDQPEQAASVLPSDTHLGDATKSRFKFAKSLKSKLKLRLKKQKKLETFPVSQLDDYCRMCTKKIKATLHPSPTVIDFEKEYHTSEIFVSENEYCNCAHDENSCSEESSGSITIKRHIHKTDSSMTISTNRPLYEEEWFHGVLPREEVVRLLRNDGDFLVRETTRNDESQTVLSVCWNGHKHFIVQTTAEGHFRFEGPAFPSIQELILHQYQSELPVTARSGAVLKKPVLRERWELSNDDVILIDKIGRGNFGDVYKAKLKSSPKKEVAVKTCRMTLPDEQKRKFLQEGRILKQYDHPNIVKLIGICVQKQPIMIVMELVPGGSLLNFLRKNAQTLSSKTLIRMCRDAAAGMRYLESKNCIHRDLAARNCLIGDENIVKISDFGMSREEEEYIVSDGMKQIPIKWTAPEALNFGKYTSLCDVWSYGILIWEIFSKGGTPYSGMSNTRARERIDAGYRMPAPDNTPSEIYRLMLKCWSYEPESRPHFDEIYTVVESLISRGTGD